ncbi:DUF302 domain-containing protein [Nonomuraea sp. NPDC050643]|uniref:DUF302 domain-containing protein n=1 Tax=Nonomuraea sp. NPDC050643 TaxID=3155660 RepID=UPI0033EE184B
MDAITHTASGSVEETLDRLKQSIASKGLTLFTVVEHDVAAETAGLSMPPAKVVIFGSPAAGTPLMIAAPLLALDLPLRILIWQDASGRTRVSYGDPGELQRRHGLTDEQAAPLRATEAIAGALV